MVGFPIVDCKMCLGGMLYKSACNIAFIPCPSLFLYILRESELRALMGADVQAVGARVTDS